MLCFVVSFCLFPGRVRFCSEPRYQLGQSQGRVCLLPLLQMSLLQSPAPVLPFPVSVPPQQQSPPRKRTSSFCYPSPALSPNPRPVKAQRTEPPAQMGSLRRTETLLVLPTMSTTASSSTPTAPTPVPYHRTLQYYKDQRQRRKRAADLPTTPHVNHVAPQQQVQPSPNSQPQPAPQRNGRSRTPRRQQQPSPLLTQIILPSVSNPIVQIRTFRSSSPLAPTRTVLPGRPVFPRSKAEPDLYRKAIVTRMRRSPEGQKILHMGPRLALSIMTATKELERIVADQHEKDGDVVMADVTVADVPPVPTSLAPQQLKGCSALPVLTNSWVVVKGDDWEMVDCGA